MTDKTQPARTWHAVSDGLTVPTTNGARHFQTHGGGGRVLRRGDEITVDDAFREATTDAFAESWTDDLSDAAQLARWGRIYFREGPLTGNPSLVDEIAKDAAAVVAAAEIEARREAARYGRRHVLAHADSVARTHEGV